MVGGATIGVDLVRASDAVPPLRALIARVLLGGHARCRRPLSRAERRRRDDPHAPARGRGGHHGLAHARPSLPAGTDLVAIPGGFSYGDYLRCGAIAKVGPIMRAVAEHAARGGYVLGVCNGFQILTECGLLPGALTRNAHLRFECRDIFVKVAGRGARSRRSVGTRAPPAHRARRGPLPGVARGARAPRGRGAHRARLLYTRWRGRPPRRTRTARSRNIAGIYGGPSKNVLGLMPHPGAHERGLPRRQRRPRALPRRRPPAPRRRLSQSRAAATHARLRGLRAHFGDAAIAASPSRARSRRRPSP